MGEGQQVGERAAGRVEKEDDDQWVAPLIVRASFRSSAPWRRSDSRREGRADAEDGRKCEHGTSRSLTAHAADQDLSPGYPPRVPPDQPPELAVQPRCDSKTFLGEESESAFRSAGVQAQNRF